MAQAPARYYRSNPCCGGAPEWNDPSTPHDSWLGDRYSADSYGSHRNWGGLYTPYGGPLSDDERAAIDAIESYGGTLKSGHDAYLAPMEHYSTDWNDRNSPIMVPRTLDSWGAPWDRNVRRISSAQELPSLPNPDAPGANPSNLPHADATRAYIARERVRSTPTEIRAVWDEEAGKHRAQILWCQSCGPDAMESFVNGLSTLGEDMVPVVRGIALVCSYIPVFGTAVSFVLNMAMNLAEGEKLENATLEAVGSALPGQPLAGMAFNVAVAIILGDQVNEVIIDGLPDPPANPVIKKGLVTSTDILISVANGETVTNASLDELERNLPPRAAQVVNIARRLANGENVEAVAVDVLGQEAANAMTNAAVAASQSGKGAVGMFVSEAAFQAVADTLPAEMNAALKAGVTLAIAKKLQDQRQSQGFTTQESAPATNDAYATKGQKLMASGIAWRNSAGKNVRVLDLRNGKTLALNMLVIDTMSGQPTRQVVTDTISETWRRGFDVAIGACDGLSADSPAQDKIRSSLTLLQAQQGFDMGQQIQFDRTTQQKWAGMKVTTTADTAKALASSPAARALHLTPQTPTYLPTRVIDFSAVKTEAQKRSEARSLWVAHYEQLSAQTSGTMTG